MWHFLQSHETVALFMVVGIVIVSVMHYERAKDRRALLDTAPRENAQAWQCVSFQGGGTVWTPRAMTRAEAVEWARSLGAVSYVDENYGKIFYKARVSG